MSNPFGGPPPGGTPPPGGGFGPPQPGGYGPPPGGGGFGPPPGGGGFGPPPGGGYGSPPSGPGGYGPPPGGPSPFGAPMANQPPPRVPIQEGPAMFLGIAVAMFCGCLPGGIIAIVLANQAKQAANRGNAVEAQSKLRMSYMVSGISMALLVVAFCLYAALMVVANA